MNLFKKLCETPGISGFEERIQKTAWDGTYKGEKQNAGDYMYSFSGTLTTNEKINQKGNITLMR